jgi:hypothetical protein
MYRRSFSPIEAEGDSGAGVSRSTGRVLGGGFTSEGSDVIPVDETPDVEAVDDGLVEVDGGRDDGLFSFHPVAFDAEVA